MGFLRLSRLFHMYELIGCSSLGLSEPLLSLWVLCNSGCGVCGCRGKAVLFLLCGLFFVVPDGACGSKSICWARRVIRCAMRCWGRGTESSSWESLSQLQSSVASKVCFIFCAVQIFVVCVRDVADFAYIFVVTFRQSAAI